MTPENYIPILLAGIAALTFLCLVLRLKWRDERDRSERLRLALLEIEMQRINRPGSSKLYHARFGGSSE